MAHAPSKSDAWLLVARDILHLEEARPGSVTWWCVTRGARAGNKCFLYRPLTGIVLYFEVLFLSEPQDFCNGFAMTTATVRILRVFDPPISAKDLKASREVRQMGFIARNFQGKAFKIDAKDTKTILKLYEPQRLRTHGKFF